MCGTTGIGLVKIGTECIASCVETKKFCLIYDPNSGVVSFLFARFVGRTRHLGFTASILWASNAIGDSDEHQLRYIVLALRKRSRTVIVFTSRKLIHPEAKMACYQGLRIVMGTEWIEFT